MHLLLNFPILRVIIRLEQYQAGVGFLIVNLVSIYFLMSFVHYALNAVLVLLSSFKTFIFKGSRTVINGLGCSTAILPVYRYTANFLECALAISRVMALVLPIH